MYSNVETKTLKPLLPDDVLLSCLARVSRLDYPTLSLVSKTFQSLIASPELYQTRSLLGHTESCLYVYLKSYPNTNPRWYTLGRNPKTLKYLLVPISIPNSPNGSSQVVLGSKIYDIGGYKSREKLSRMSILNCWSHIWCEGPSMQVERFYPAVNVFDGKIYVGGGCEECNPSTWMEVFDPKTQIWESVFFPRAEAYENLVKKSAVIEGTIYMFANENIAYKPMEDRWELGVGRSHLILDSDWSSYSYCVIDDVLYSILDGMKWYDSKMRNWRVVNGLPPRFGEYGPYGRFRLADYGGKMAAFWFGYASYEGCMHEEIHFEVIALERRDNHEIWGNIESSDVVFIVPWTNMFIEKALAVTV